MASPKIILYTDKFCPWTHRVYMALKETGLDYEEVIVDITKPREPWYLEINPVGL
jgi:glutathione S-transferase